VTKADVGRRSVPDQPECSDKAAIESACRVTDARNSDSVTIERTREAKTAGDVRHRLPSRIIHKQMK
jgi:hypothetical protein